MLIYCIFCYLFFILFFFLFLSDGSCILKGLVCHVESFLIELMVRLLRDCKLLALGIFSVLVILLGFAELLSTAVLGLLLLYIYIVYSVHDECEEISPILLSIYCYLAYPFTIRKSKEAK